MTGQNMFKDVTNKNESGTLGGTLLGLLNSMQNGITKLSNKNLPP